MRAMEEMVSEHKRNIHLVQQSKSAISEFTLNTGSNQVSKLWIGLEDTGTVLLLRPCKYGRISSNKQDYRLPAKPGMVPTVTIYMAAPA